MARMMGVGPDLLPVQKAAAERGLGNFQDEDIEIQGPFEVIPNFKMSVTFAPERWKSRTSTRFTTGRADSRRVTVR